jgi:integrase
MSLAMTPAIAHDEHKRITERSGPFAANDAMKLMSAIYNYAARFDVRLPRDRHPCSAVEWNLEHGREGAAIPPEMMRQWKRQLEAMRFRSPVHAAFHMLCLRLGARPGELARSKWRDVDWKRQVLTMPLTKRFSYEIPLTPQALGELRKLCSLPIINRETTEDFIFPSPRMNMSGGCIQFWRETKDVLTHTGICGRHTHHTIGTSLEINEIILDVLEGRSIARVGLVGRQYVDRGSLGQGLRRAQEKIDGEIDRLFAGGARSPRRMVE